MLDKARRRLVKLTKRQKLNLRQNYNHKGKALAIQIGRYAHAKPYKRMGKGVKKLKTYLGRVVRDIDRKTDVNTISNDLRQELTIAKTLLLQEKKSQNKLYSIHEPNVYCIAKGKARTPYAYGSKVSLVTTTQKRGFLLT